MPKPHEPILNPMLNPMLCQRAYKADPIRQEIVKLKNRNQRKLLNKMRQASNSIRKLQINYRVFDTIPNQIIPIVAEINDAAMIPTLAICFISSSLNAKSEINIDIVNPIPAKKATP